MIGNGLDSGLGMLPILGNVRTRSVSPENPTGEKGKGGMAVPGPEFPFSEAASDLGRGWKVNPFHKVRSGETLTIMDVQGSGIIQHIWMVADPDKGRSHVLRFYWDGEDSPSVETPVSDFFAVGHNQFAPVNSLAVVVNPKSAFNCYWPMPYRKGAKITFTNEDEDELNLLTFQITYAETEVDSDVGYFHAQWRRQVIERQNPDYAIIDNINGRGKYIGTFLAWTQLSDGWFGEGEIKFFIDGDEKFPTICGTGTEDYLCGSFGFPELYSTAYVGNVLKCKDQNGPPKWSLYRWHIMDPIHFDQDLKVTIQALGWWPNGKYQPLNDDIASVAYWYQTDPHTTFPSFPPLEKRCPR